MRILIVEDDLVSRNFLHDFLIDYGPCELSRDGMEALDAYSLAWKEKKPYDLICMDVMMPRIDGIKALKLIREIEEKEGFSRQTGVKIIITSALNDTDLIQSALVAGAESYCAKPIDTSILLMEMRKLGLPV